jgi:hypothetical protein
MEFTRVEVNAIESTAIEAAQTQVQELNDLQLMLIGGGNVIVTIG